MTIGTVSFGDNLDKWPDTGTSENLRAGNAYFVMGVLIHPNGYARFRRRARVHQGAQAAMVVLLAATDEGRLR